MTTELVLRKASPYAIIEHVQWDFLSYGKKGVLSCNGKKWKGKECGKGTCQRKDGKYSARFYDKFGKRNERYCNPLPEVRNWLADAQYQNGHGLVPATTEMTADTWDHFWMENLISDLAPHARRNYAERYLINIKPVVGNMLIADVKPMHCKTIFNRMEAIYAG